MNATKTPAQQRVLSDLYRTADEPVHEAQFGDGTWLCTWPGQGSILIAPDGDADTVDDMAATASGGIVGGAAAELANAAVRGRQ